MRKWKRICVIGASGSGKSTLAIALGEKYGLPAFHLDRELLHGQFEPLPFEKQQHRHNEITKAERWVIDGSYKKLIDQRLERAELVVYLNISRLRTVPRVLRRYLKAEHRRDSIPGEAKNAMSANFIWWCIKYSRRGRLNDIKIATKKYPHLTLVALKNDTTDGWLEQIGQLT